MCCAWICGFPMPTALHPVIILNCSDGSQSYIITPAYTEETIAFFKSKGVKFASESDACNAILRIASDTTVNGRSIAVVSKEDCAGGYFDLAEDDFPEGSKLYDLQNVAINVGSRT